MILVKGKRFDLRDWYLRTFITPRDLKIQLHTRKILYITTKLRNLVGKSQHQPQLVRNRKRFQRLHYSKLTSTEKMQAVPSLVSGLFSSSTQQKLSFTCLTSTNSLFFHNLTGMKLFGFTFFNRNRLYPKFNSLISSVLLLLAKRNVNYKCVRGFKDDVPKYALSAGSFAKPISMHFETGQFLLKLPSGTRRLFFILSQVIEIPKHRLTSPDINSMGARLAYQSAGYYINRGFRSKVRGVAMNPVDHPHGGRTKSIRLPKTPWGLPTKLK